MLKDQIALIYELWNFAYLGDFSELMYQNNLYMRIAIYTLLIAVGITLLYYYVIDRPKLAKLPIWLLMLTIGSTTGLFVAYLQAYNNLVEIFSASGQAFPDVLIGDVWVFSLINAMWTALLIFFFSWIFKWKSTNASYIPF